MKKVETRKNPNRSGRLALMSVLMCLALLLLLVDVFYIKRTHGDEYEQAAQAQQTNLLDAVIEPLRGNIYDAAGQPLAVSTRAYNVIMDSSVLYAADERQQKSTVKVLGDILGLEDPDSLYEYFGENYKNWQYLKVPGGQGISEADMKKIRIEADAGRVVGIWFEETENRTHPEGSLAAQILGFNGVYGLEQYYDDELTGTAGRKMIVSDAQGTYSTEQIEAKNGNNLTLTLNATVQKYMEEELQASVKKYNSLNACAICMNCKTGAIVGWANVPTFDLDDVTTVIGASTKFQKKYSEEDESYYSRVWNNYGLVSTYQPGSTYKPIFSSIALEEGLIGTGTRFSCVRAGYRIPDTTTTIECFEHHVHKTQTLREVLINSCNQGMAQISTLIPRATYFKYQEAYGVGHLTGIDLAGEVDAASLVYGEDDLNPVEKATCSYGQGFNVTPIQLLCAFNACINGGEYLKPYVVSRISDQYGNILKTNTKTVLRHTVSEQTSKILRPYLEDLVTTNLGKRFSIPGYTFGGKTGTAQQGGYEKEEDIVSFVCFTPAEDPEYIMLVVMNQNDNAESLHCSLTAAAIMKKILPVLGVYPKA